VGSNDEKGAAPQGRPDDHRSSSRRHPTPPAKTSRRRRPPWGCPTTAWDYRDAARAGYIDRETADDMIQRRGDALW
jgi:hypothetical protein